MHVTVEGNVVNRVIEGSGGAKSLTVDGVAVDGHLDVVAISTSTRTPIILAVLSEHGHDAVGATCLVLAKLQFTVHVVVEVAGSEGVVVGTVECANQLFILEKSPAKAQVKCVGGKVVELARNIDGERVARVVTCAIVTVEFDIFCCDLKDVATTLVGLETHDGTLGVDVAIGTAGATRALQVGIEYVKHEVAVALAIPTPVDVEHAITIIAVADEGMATALLVATIDDRASSRKLAINEVCPSLSCVALAALHVGTGIVVKVSGGPERNAGSASPRASGFEVHFQRLSAIK